jgi:hypothetical protein
MASGSKDRGGTGARSAGGGERGRRGGPRRGEGRRGGAPVGGAAIPSYEVAVVVDRRQGVRVVKASTIERTSHRVIRVVYRVEFEGCAPIEFDRLGEARARGAEPPPEQQAAAPEASANEAIQPAAENASALERETTETAPSDPGQVRH